MARGACAWRRGAQLTDMKTSTPKTQSAADALVRTGALQSAMLNSLYMSGYTKQTAARRAGMATGLPLVQKPFTAAERVRHVRGALNR